jgi:hypothetical protein
MPGPAGAAASNARDVDLQRLLQMTLILSTQAAYSSFYPFSTDDAAVAEARDYEVRTSVAELSKVVRRRIDGALSDGGEGGEDVAQAQARTRGRADIQRKASMLGRRRKGWRASAIPDLALAAMSLGGGSSQGPAQAQAHGQGQGFGYGHGPMPGRVSRQQSEVQGHDAYGRWGQPNDGDEDEDDVAPGQGFGYARRDTEGYGAQEYGEMARYRTSPEIGMGTTAGTGTGTSSAAASSATATATPGGTWRDGGRHWDESTPQAAFMDARGTRARAHSASAGLGQSEEGTPVAGDYRRAQRV